MSLNYTTLQNGGSNYLEKAKEKTKKEYFQQDKHDGYQHQKDNNGYFPNHNSRG